MRRRFLPFFLVDAMATCLVALGSNLGDRQAVLDRAVEALDTQHAIRIEACSGWHLTKPIGGPSGQPEYLNGAVRLGTDLAPRVLLSVLQQIEQDLGRKRWERWGARSIDLDLLLYGERVIRTPELVVPHPRMSFRRFVLAPAMEVASEMVHPVIGWSLAELMAHLDMPFDYVAIAGPIGVGKTWLAEGLRYHFGGRLIRGCVDSNQLSDDPLDRAGRAYRTEIRFLEQRTVMLDQRDWGDVDCTKAERARTDLELGEVGAGVVRSFSVSDFWFNQSLSYAKVCLGARSYRHFCQVWKKAHKRVALPKLLLVLDAPVDWLYERLSSRNLLDQQFSRKRFEELHTALLERAESPSHGPTLWLSGQSPDESLVEAKAAVEAMQ